MSNAIIIIVAIAIYLLPTIVAGVRGKQGEVGVLFVNLLLGWTVLGWFAAFIWACSGPTVGDKRRAERQHAEILAALQAKNGGSP